MQDAHQPNLQRVIPYIVSTGIVEIFIVIIVHQGSPPQNSPEGATYSGLSRLHWHAGFVTAKFAAYYSLHVLHQYFGLPHAGGHAPGSTQRRIF